LTQSENSKLVLLAVLAHPDDETFGLGGTLALYAQRGVVVHLVCATRGEAGSVEVAHLEGYSSIEERRVDELRCAAGVLDLAGVHFLDYRDSGMPGSPDNSHPRALVAAPLEEVATRIVDYIRRLQPQVVLTFDPIGGYKHPDHIAVHQATTRAFYLAGDPGFVTSLPPFQPQKLYYHVMPKNMLRFWIRYMRLFGRDPRHFGKNKDIDLVSLVEDGDFPIHATIDCHRVMDKKEAATACHKSQLDGGMPRRGVLSWLSRWLGRKEQYMRAYPPPEDGRREKDLFTNVNI